jgi:DNA-binding MarR family transcriptional regulator
MGSHASADAASILDSIRRVVRFLRESESETRRRTGLSAAQLFLLQHLDAAGGTLTPGELARRTLTHQSSISTVARRLLDNGLLSRARASADRRRVALSLTKDGRKALRRAPQVMQERLIAAVDQLPVAQRGKLARGLVRLVWQLGIAGAPPPMLFEDGVPHAR